MKKKIDNYTLAAAMSFGMRPEYFKEWCEENSITPGQIMWTYANGASKSEVTAYMLSDNVEAAKEFFTKEPYTGNY